MNRPTENNDSQDETIMALLDSLLNKTIRYGSLTVIDPKGRSTAYGDGSGYPLTVRIHNTKTALKILFDPQLAVGEAYMDGTLTVEVGTIYDVIDLVFRNLGLNPLEYPLSGVTERLRTGFRRLAQFNPAGRSRKNVAHHYDLSDTLYDLFLDGDRQYSCAYVMDPSDTIETPVEAGPIHCRHRIGLGRLGALSRQDRIGFCHRSHTFNRTAQSVTGAGRGCRPV